MKTKALLFFAAVTAALLLFIFVAGWRAASAQPAPQPSDTAKVQALANRLTVEINNNLACTENVITLQEQVKKLSAELVEAKKERDGNGTPAKKKP